jgi:hypothetical protein
MDTVNESGFGSLIRLGRWGIRAVTANRSLPGKQEYLGFGRGRFHRSIRGGIRSAGDRQFSTAAHFIRAREE